MSFAETVLLGAIAGFTIYLGLPVGRLGRVSDRARGRAGDVLGRDPGVHLRGRRSATAQAIVENGAGQLQAQRRQPRARGRTVRAPGRAASLAGTAGISGIEQHARRRTAPRPPIAGGESPRRSAPPSSPTPYERSTLAAARCAPG